MHVIATAGHVDHGKSTLVRTLTGTDPDRFAEEKERGLTIDIGFGSCQLPSGRGVSFVDVPGHVRFLKNMLAGVGAVDACLFVVAATEGWKPQSEEHLRILQLLGMQRGVIALTKISMADDDLRELARMDVEEQIEGTFLEGAEIVELDALDGIGVDELIAALDRLTESTPTAIDIGRPRLWVDRAFSAKGAGTIVTGTLAGGSISVDDELGLLPGLRPVRVRAIQSLHRDQPTVGPGNRTAANLNGISHDQVVRGDVLVRPDQWHQTTSFDASIEVLPSLDHDLSRRGAHLLYLGSGEFPVQVRVLGTAAIPPGGSGFVRFHVTEPLPVVPGDRFILRESGRAETVGGGEILDVDPLLRASRARPDRSTARVIAERGWVEVDLLERLTGERRDPNVGSWAVSPEALAATIAEVEQAVADAGPLGLDLASLDDHGRAVVDRLEGVTIDAGRVVAADAIDPLADHPYVAALEAEPFTPPSAEGVDRDELRELVRRGLVVAEDGVWFAPAAIDEAALIVARLLADKPTGVTVAEIRDSLGTTRKYGLPLLALLDGRGITRRRDDVRIAGPRLPELE